MNGESKTLWCKDKITTVIVLVRVEVRCQTAVVLLLFRFELAVSIQAGEDSKVLISMSARHQQSKTMNECWRPLVYCVFVQIKGFSVELVGSKDFYRYTRR